MIIDYIRHAESTYNERKLMQGRADAPLSARGREQSVKLASRFRGFANLYSYLVCSPLERARETANELASATSLHVCEDTNLLELDLGQFSGLTWLEAQERFPDCFQTGLETFWHLFRQNQIPGQETYESLCARSATFFQKLSKRFPSENTHVLVVGHKGFLECFMANTIGYTIDRSFFGLGSTSVNRLKFENGIYTFLVINDLSHLKEGVVNNASQIA